MITSGIVYDHDWNYYTKRGIRSISQSLKTKQEKKPQRPAMLFRNYKINSYLVRKILDNSLNVWMVYFLA